MLKNIDTCFLVILLFATPMSVKAADPLFLSVETSRTARRIPVHPGIYGASWIRDWDGKQLEDFASVFQNNGVTCSRFPGGWESERYDYHENKYYRTWNWKGKELTWKGPDADTFIETMRRHKVEPTLVVRTERCINEEDEPKIIEEAEYAAGIVAKYAAYVRIWEIGNEWYLMGKNKADSRRKQYAKIVNEYVPRMLAAAPGIKIYITVDWHFPEDVKPLRSMINPEVWSNIQGLTLHMYSGEPGPDNPEAHKHMKYIEERLKRIRTLSGGKGFYVSEWNASVRVSDGRRGIVRSNIFLEVFDNILKSGGWEYGALWAYKDAAPNALTMKKTFDLNSTGVLLSWLSKGMRGYRVPVQGVPDGIVATAALAGNKVVLFLAARESEPREVRIRVNGLRWSRGVGRAMYNKGDHLKDKTPLVSRFPITIKGTGNTKTACFRINSGGETRGSKWEIVQIVLMP